MPQRLLTLSDLADPADPVPGPSSGPAAPMPTLGPATGKLLTLSDLEKDPGGSEDSFGSQALGVGGDFVQGIGASGLSIPVGAYNLLRKGIRSLPPMPQMLEDSTHPPDTTAGHIGEFAGDLATFALPGGLEEKAISKIPVTGKLAHAGVRAGMDALTAGTIEGVKSGGDPTKTAAAAASAGALGGALEAGSEPLLRAVTDVWGKATGAGGVAIRRAAVDASQGLKDAMRSKVAEDEIVQNLRDAAKTVRTNRANEYRQAMQQLDQTIQLDLQPVDQAVFDQTKAFGIQPLAIKGQQFANSPIVDPNDRQIMLNAIAEVHNMKDLSPAGMDLLKRKLTNYADMASRETRPFFYRIADAVKRELGDNVPGYRELTKSYEEASELLQTVDKELSAGNQNPGVTFRKLSNALNQHNEFKKILLEDLDSAAGTDLSGQIAGYHLRQWTPRGLAGVGAGLATAYMHDPRVLLSGAIASPRVAGELMALVSAMRKYTPKAISNMPASAVAPAISNQVLPNDLTPPPPANLAPPPPR